MKQKPSKKMKMEKAICQRGANKNYIFVDINCTDFSKGGTYLCPCYAGI